MAKGKGKMSKGKGVRRSEKAKGKADAGRRK
jgi:hypothetical protein